jgi:hypothetical protein
MAPVVTKQVSEGEKQALHKAIVLQDKMVKSLQGNVGILQEDNRRLSKEEDG